jgi:hypothetical protein
VNFSEQNGTYYYFVSPVAGYTFSNNTGSMVLNGRSVSQTITFTSLRYAIEIRIVGVGTNPSWNLKLYRNATSTNRSTQLYINRNFTGNSAIITLPIGNYNFTISVAGSYLPKYTNLSIVVISNQTLTVYVTNTSQFYKPNYSIIFEITTGILAIVAVAEGLCFYSLRKKR